VQPQPYDSSHSIASTILGTSSAQHLHPPICCLPHDTTKTSFRSSRPTGSFHPLHPLVRPSLSHLAPPLPMSSISDHSYVHQVRLLYLHSSTKVYRLRGLRVRHLTCPNNHSRRAHRSSRPFSPLPLTDDVHPRSLSLKPNSDYNEERTLQSRTCVGSGEYCAMAMLSFHGRRFSLAHHSLSHTTTHPPLHHIKRQTNDLIHLFLHEVYECAVTSEGVQPADGDG
jgi:hypothetical protein